tara:strand:- start:939 stop:1040 length:102 start_codon:yes stop_codon:yes gene_type:complete
MIKNKEFAVLIPLIIVSELQIVTKKGKERCNAA